MTPFAVRKPAVLGLLFLLVAGALPAVAASSTGDGYLETDGTGDVAPRFFSAGSQGILPAATPETAATNMFDIKELRLSDEDALGLQIHLSFVDLKSNPYGSANGIINGPAEYELDAQLQGTKFHYAISWDVPAIGPTDPVPQGVQDTTASFCLYESDPGGGDFGGGGCGFFTKSYFEKVVAKIDWGASRLDAYITKDGLMGRDPVDAHAVPPGNAPLLTAGMQLTGLTARAGQFFPVPLTDTLPDPGKTLPPYVFQQGAANTKVRLLLDPGSGATGNATNGSDLQGGNFNPFGPPPPTHVSVIPGQSNLVPLRVDNLANGKRILTLSAEIVAPNAEGKWKAQVVKSVQIPSGESRTFNLIVNASSSLQHRDQASIVVRGQSLGFADELAAVRVELVASALPDPAHPTLYFHAAKSDSNSNGGLLAPVCDALPFFGCGPRAPAWTNTLREDAKGTLDAGTRMGDCTIDDPTTFLCESTFAMDTAFSQDVVLDPKQPITGTLAFTSNIPITADVAAEVTTTQGRLVGSGSVGGPLASGTPVAFSFAPLKDALRTTPAEKRWNIHVSVRGSAANAGPAEVLPTFAFVPKDSQFTFPIVPDPRASTKVVAGLAFISLAARGDVDEFVNPERTTVFNGTLLNEGVESDDAVLQLSYDQPDWTVSLLPGLRYRVPAGDGAKFSILATAPANAKEGDTLHITLNATSDQDPGAMSQLRFAAIVTKGLDIPDQATSYKVDPDSGAKVVGKPVSKKAPGVEFLGLAVGILAALGAAGERRRRP